MYNLLHILPLWVFLVCSRAIFYFPPLNTNCFQNVLAEWPASQVIFVHQGFSYVNFVCRLLTIPSAYVTDPNYLIPFNLYQLRVKLYTVNFLLYGISRRKVWDLFVIVNLITNIAFRRLNVNTHKYQTWRKTSKPFKQKKHNIKYVDLFPVYEKNKL